ncbi:hypothetical protein [Cutibacterium sp. V947]
MGDDEEAGQALDEPFSGLSCPETAIIMPVAAGAPESVAKS